MRSQLDSYSMLICSKYVRNISDMINITLVNSKFRENIDKFHFNPFQINQNSRKYFSHLQTQWLFDEDDKIYSDGDISGYYVYYQLSYGEYLEMKDKYQNIKFRRIIYTYNDKMKYGNEIPFVVNKLNYDTFYYSNIEEINMPDSIVEIENQCFNYCPLTSITISSRLTKIGESAFFNCTKLSSITLPSVLTSLNNGLFSNCNKLTRIEYSPFVVDLDDKLFHGSGFSTLTIPTSITRIGDYCLYGCKITSITIPSNVIHFGEYAFSYNKEIKEVELPNNIMELSESIFSCCYILSQINIPSSLTKIGESCFNACVELNEINMPMSVVEIGKEAFKGCSKLQSITGNVDVCKKFKDCFENTPKLKKVLGNDKIGCFIV